MFYEGSPRFLHRLWQLLRNAKNEQVGVVIMLRDDDPAAALRKCPPRFRGQRQP